MLRYENDDRFFGWLSYAAGSWPAKRHVVVKVEHSCRCARQSLGEEEAM